MANLPQAQSRPPKSAREIIDEARTKYLRTFADVYNAQIVDLAENGNGDAINLLVFDERKELQTPKASELGVQDWWSSMLALDPLMVTAE